MPNSKIVFLDTNVFIYFFQYNPNFSADSKRIFQKITANKLRAVTSVLTLTELLSISAPELMVQKLLRLLLEIPNLEIVPISSDAAIEAARLRRQYGFSTPDSIQIAVALEKKVGRLITNDKQLKKCKELVVELLKSA